MRAFVGESQARNRYDMMAGVAKKEGFIHIMKIFEETAQQESEHAKRLFGMMQGGSTALPGEQFGMGPIGTTRDNLAASVAGETHEVSAMYPSFATVATREGFPQIAAVFTAIATAERYHAARFRTFLTLIDNGTIFKREGKVLWRCLNCGSIHEGDMPPEKCPACDHPRSYFEALDFPTLVKLV
eukprot:TRINITY_DN692_c0_g4_i3.p1 TRINITY_DN692_c0_g4~~TRINITY_DN692_c0_g4_i3.p1  ORF type:complete len:185 (+),score=48.58 TRINITY_DN692_c0_g4_i3:79-633(+)